MQWRILPIANNTVTDGNMQFFDSAILYQSQYGDDGISTFAMNSGTINNTD